MHEKVKVARLSIFSNAFLIVIKLVVSVLGGSVGVLSEAIHSTVDLLASFIAFFAVRISTKPPDEEHPYGHGKYENVSGVIEALLIFLAAVWIIYEAVQRLLHPQKIEYALWGFGVMALSALVNIYVSRKLYKAARKYDSVALEADALHLKTDVYTSAGVAAAFLILYFTGIHWIDSLVAILIAVIIFYEAYMLMKQAFSPLLDTQLPPEQKNEIIRVLNDVLKEYKDAGYDKNKLRTRKSGAMKYLDFVLLVPGDYTVSEAHKLCDIIEEKIRSRIPNTDINIHVEPFPGKENPATASVDS